jgi:hypothetical protein
MFFSPFSPMARRAHARWVGVEDASVRGHARNSPTAPFGISSRTFYLFFTESAWWIERQRRGLELWLQRVVWRIERQRGWLEQRKLWRVGCGQLRRVVWRIERQRRRLEQRQF